jgi:hypothetical protein
MTNAASFGNLYFQTVQNLVNDLETLQELNDRIVQDATLIPSYFTSGGARTDIVAQDVTNAESAVNQLLFTFNSGSPTQKSFLFKLL